MKNGIVILSLLLFTAGCGNHAHYKSSMDHEHSTFQTPIPGEVIWHGVKFKTTLSEVTHVGGKLGAANDLVHKAGKKVSDPKEKYDVFRIPGHNPDKEIAVKVNALNKKYVKYVRLKSS